MRFAEPLAFLALLIVPIVALWFAFSERRRRALVEAAGDAALLGGLTGLGPEQGRQTRLVETVLFALALALVAVALARPQFGAKTEVRKARGMDVVIALDLSRSMLAQDVAPSRLERAKIELNALIQSLGGDRVGLVGFTSAAIPLCPMTVDHSALELQLKSAGPDAMPRGGTAIADAIEEAQRMLASSPHKESGKAIIVVTDGEEHEGDPEGAAKAAHEAGIEVHTVGVGSAAGEPIPLANEGYLRDANGQTVISRLDEGILGRVAAAGGGISALPGAGGGFDLSPVIARLAQQNKADLEARTVRVYEERYRWALVPAFVLLMLATMIRVRRSRSALAVIALPVLLGAGPFEREEPNVATGNQALKDGKAKDAIGAYDKAQKTVGQDPRLLLNRGLAQAADGELDKAIESYKAAVAAAQDPNVRAKAAYALGNAERSLKKFDEAIQSYRRALIDDPTHSGARKNLELTAAMKRIQALQPKQPNPDGDKGEDKPNDPNKDGGVGDSGPQDGGTASEDGSGPSEADGGPGGDGSSDNASPDASGSGPEAGASGGTSADAEALPDAGGAQSSPQKEAEPAEDKDREAVLDALEAKEKALQNKRRTKGIKPRRVEKDW